MELYINDKSNSQNIEAFKINNILEPHMNTYQIVCYSTKIKDQIKFVASLYHKEDLLLRFEYIILGSYHKSKNVWIWADRSLTLNKTIIEQITNMRLVLSDSKDTIITEDVKNFCKNNYSILSTQSYCNIISTIALKIFNDNFQRVITFARGDELIDVYLIKRIIFEKIL